MIPLTEYKEPEINRNDGFYVPDGPRLEFIGRYSGDPTRLRWITQTANQAVGTGYLIAQRLWSYYFATEKPITVSGWAGVDRGYQSARIGFGAL